MGNDGGSIPKRRELVKEAARLPTASELKATALESLAHAWTTCPLSSEPLDPASTTVVSDWRGRLYSYESVLQCLMPSSSLSSSAESSLPETQQAEFARTGIRGLKDVVKLQFAVRKDERGRPFRACPVSMKELGAGTTRAVYVVPCGHVFAEVAIKETLAVGTTTSGTTATTNKEIRKEEEGAVEEEGTDDHKLCPECSQPFQERDIIPILSTDEAEIERLAKRVEELKALGLTHSLKKDKSGGKKKRKAGEAKEESGTNGEAKEKRDKNKKADKGKNGISSRINNSATASLTAKVLAEQEERNKRRKIADGFKRSEAVR